MLVWLVLFCTDAHAAVANAGVLDSVRDRFFDAASRWQTYITEIATWLFWTLVLISMVWTFGMMGLSKADIGEFFAEFVRFTIFTGFFWWLLYNGPVFAMAIIGSLEAIGRTASSAGSVVSPSGIVDIGVEIFFKMVDKS